MEWINLYYHFTYRIADTNHGSNYNPSSDKNLSNIAICISDYLDRKYTIDDGDLCMNNIIPINSEHISYTVISENDKSLVKVTVAENAVPKNTDKIHISVFHTVNSSQPEEQNVLASIDYRTSPITIPGMETNEFGIAIAGSQTPTASDFE